METYPRKLIRKIRLVIQCIECNCHIYLKITHKGTSLWLPPCSQCMGLGLIPGQGTRSHTPQLRVCMSQLKIPGLQLKPGITK